MSSSRKFFKYCLMFSLVLVWLLCISTWAQAKTYYVANNGNDSNPGTEEKPWLTIQKAAETIVAGDTVYVKEGTYNGFGVHTVGTSFDNLVSYLAYPGNTVKVGRIYFWPGANYNKIDGFIIQSYSGGCVDLEGTGGAVNYNIISHNLLMGDPDNWGDSGGIGYGGKGHIFEGNEICWSGPAFHPGGPNPPDGTLIKNNVAHDIMGHGFAGVGGKNEKIIGNIIYNCHATISEPGTGIFLATGSPENALIAGNLVYNCEGYAIAVEGSGHSVINNTCYHSDPNANRLYYMMGSNMVIKNNIGYRKGVGKQVVLLRTDSITDYNCWFNPDETKCINRWYEPMTLSTYQTYGQGAHSISQDPKFVSLAGNDFHLQLDSPCIGAGENGVDMGAYGAGELPPVYEGPGPDPAHEGLGPDAVSEEAAQPDPVDDDPPDDGVDGVRNRPNPFRAGKEVTLIRYSLNQPSNVTITIYNLLGQEVWGESYRAGENGGREDNSVPWDGRNLSGEVVGNGGYICRIWIEREKRAMIRKIAIAK